MWYIRISSFKISFMPDQMTPMSKKDTFTFLCHRGVSCFNQCCRDLNQVLTPYDILRLKNRLSLSSGDFLKQYTIQSIGPRSGLPVVTFRTERADGLRCPFVTAQGCSVYEDRPGSCRAYPLARVVSRSQETGRLSERYMLIREDHCFGFEEARRQTIAEWTHNQGLDEYNDMNDRVLDLIRLKNLHERKALDPTCQHLLRLALYDIDGFREFAAEQRLTGASLPVSDLETTDDMSLLKFSIHWVQRVFRD
jgi:Fe-S-cluster containining protein